VDPRKSNIQFAPNKLVSFPEYKKQKRPREPALGSTQKIEIAIATNQQAAKDTYKSHGDCYNDYFFVLS
jgi:hypothetical protein